MEKNSVVPLRNRQEPPEGRDASWRRVSHGSTRFASAPRQRQPQDGAESPTRVASISSRLQPTLAMEPEDARLTGLTRSLSRRLLGLNVVAVPDPAVPWTAPLPVRKPQQRKLAEHSRQAHVA